ncbi:MAG: hypothetical protein ABI861_10565 [Panacibacter sp.]
MKKSILLTAYFLCCTILATTAQSSPYIYKWPKNNNHSLSDLLQERKFKDSLWHALPNQEFLYGNMPNAGTLPKRFNYIGNNQRGLDIYQADLDNMYILKPDAGFSSNMPVSKGLSLTIKPVEMPNPKKEKKN